MKTTFIFTALLASVLTFGQIKIDLNKNEAKQAFYNSNIRKALNIKRTSFNYNEIIKLSKLWNTKGKLSDIFILNSTKDKELIQLIKRYYSWYELNEATKGQNGCVDCNSILYQDKNTTKKKDIFFR